MIAGILGKKVGMTQVFKDNGDVVPVTVITAGPCTVLQVKNKDKDGYLAVQLAFDECREKGVPKASLARFKKVNSKPKRFVQEIRLNTEEKLDAGQNIEVDIFKAGDFVDITGTSIGKGFQGGMKRWNWSGGGAGHGSMSHRRPGSIGSNTDPGRVWKGHHLPGRMGHARVTTQNLEVVRVDKEKNMIMVKGAVPGANNAYLVIKKAKKR